MDDSSGRKIDVVQGTAIPLRGHDIDTDRIIPARFLKSITFEGLEDHIFEDDRKALDAQGATHPFSNPIYRGASILVVNRNFGSGSSREHAPQGLRAWGIKAVVGESFSEIFFGNSAALGLPCLTLHADDVTWLQGIVEALPATLGRVSVKNLTVSTPDRTLSAGMPRSIQEALLAGTWDATGLLLDDFDQVEAVAKRLPYINRFA